MLNSRRPSSMTFAKGPRGAHDGEDMGGWGRQACLSWVCLHRARSSHPPYAGALSGAGSENVTDAPLHVVTGAFG
jgi:hypothetical protein